MVREVLDCFRVFANYTAEDQVAMIQKVLVCKFPPIVALVLITAIVGMLQGEDG